MHYLVYDLDGNRILDWISMDNRRDIQTMAHTMGRVISGTNVQVTRTRALMDDFLCVFLGRVVRKVQFPFAASLSLSPYYLARA